MDLKKFVSDNIIDLGGDKHEDKHRPKETTSVPENKTVVFTESSPVSVTDSSNSDLGRARQKIAEMLKGANAPGIDYYEFSQSLQDLVMIENESSRFQTAYKMLAKMGLNKQIINSSIDTYMKMLDTEIEKIKEASSQLQSEIATKESAIASKQDQITALSREISALRTEVQDSKDKVSSKTNAFVQAATESKQAMQSDRNKINSYIK